jgi:Fe2+ transport system protein B
MSEYETPLEQLMESPEQEQQMIQQQQQMIQQQQQMIQQPQQQMTQQAQQQMMQPPQQQMMQPPQQQMMQPPPSSGNNFMEKLSSINFADAIQNIIFIIIIFMIFGSCYFKSFCKSLPFICIQDGEFNVQSLIIIGFLAGISFVIMKHLIT